MMPSRSCSGERLEVRRSPSETRLGRSKGDRPPTSVDSGPCTLVGSAGTFGRAACSAFWPAIGSAAPTIPAVPAARIRRRSEEHTSELQSQSNLVCRLLLEKKKKQVQHSNHAKILSTAS